MAKELTGNRVRFDLEFYWRGKKKTPSVNFVFENETSDGLDRDIEDSIEFEMFNKAAHDLCKLLVETGELG